MAVGIWLAVDQTSLLVLLKFTQTENVLVSNISFLLFVCHALRLSQCREIGDENP